MKRLLHFVWILLLVQLLAFGALRVSGAPVEYGVQIAGVRVTSENVDELNSSSGVFIEEVLSAAGSVHFDEASKTLTLRDARIVVSDDFAHGVQVDREGVVLVLAGDSRVEYLGHAYGASALRLETSVEVRGDGKLHLYGKYQPGLYIAKGATLRLLAGSEVLLAGYRAIATGGASAEEPRIDVDGGILKVVEPKRGAQMDLPSDLRFDLHGGGVAYPAGATCSAEGVLTCPGNLLQVGGVLVDYGLVVNGVRVTSASLPFIHLDLLFGNWANLGLAYDPAGKELTFSVGQYSSWQSDVSLDYALVNESVDGLTIRVHGHVRLHSSRLMHLQRATRLVGDSLTLIGYNNAAIRTEGLLTVEEGLHLTARGRQYGIQGVGSGGLRVLGGSVTAVGEQGAVFDLHSLNLGDGYAIREPIAATFTFGRIAAGGTVCKLAHIGVEPVSYGFSLGGKLVTTASYRHLSEADWFPSLKGQSAFYDPEANELRLALYAMPDEGDVPLIENITNDGLRLMLEGDMMSRGVAPVLRVHSGLRTELGARWSECRMRSQGNAVELLRGATLEVVGEHKVFILGERGIVGTDAHLRMMGTAGKMPTLAVKGHSVSVSGLKSVDLGAGMGLHLPRGAAFVAESHSVELGGGAVNAWVVWGAASRRLLGFKVGDVEVTEENYEQLSDPMVFPALRSGQMSYDIATKRLRLASCDLRVESGAVIHNLYVEGMELDLVDGTTHMETGTAESALQLGADTRISGGDMHLSGGTAIFLRYDANLVLDGCRVSAGGSYGGVRGERVIWRGEDVYINRSGVALRNATLVALARSGGYGVAVGSIRTFSMDGVGIVEPAGAQFVAGQRAVCTSEFGGPVSDRLVVGSAPVVEYGVSIGGVRVDSYNYRYVGHCAHFPAVQSGWGSAHFDPVVSKLTLHDAVIDAHEVETDPVALSVQGGGGLTVELTGKSRILGASANPSVVLHDNARLTIRNEGYLLVQGDESSAVKLHEGSHLSVAAGAYVALGAPVHALQGMNGASGTLEVNDATLVMRGQGDVIRGLAQLDLQGVQIFKPLNAAFSAGSHSVVDQGTGVPVQGVLAISARVAENYGFSIDGRQITSYDAPFMGALPVLIDGALEYDAATHTLTLLGASIVEPTGDWASVMVDAGFRPLTIRCVGSGSVPSLRLLGSCILTGESENFVISGSASQSHAIVLGANVTLTFDGLIGTQNTIAGISGVDGQSGESVVVRKSWISLYPRDGESMAVFTKIQNLTLGDGISIFPENCVFDSHAHGIKNTDDGQLMTERTDLGPELYDVRIGDVELMSWNLALLSDQSVFVSIKEGIVSYDPASRTLTLDNALIESVGVALGSTLNDLRINLKGHNRLVSNSTGLQLDLSAKIEGSGTLDISAKWSGIHVEGGAKLLVDRTTVRVSKAAYGISSGNLMNGPAELIVMGGTLHFTGKEKAMRGIGSLTMSGVKILEPLYANYQRRTIRVNGLTVRDRDVLIAPSPVQSVSVTPKLMTLYYNHPRGGNAGQMAAEVLPAGISPTVRWRSDNLGVATVDELTGLVVAHSVGTANVIASPEADWHMAASAVVDVKSYKAVTSFDLVCPTEMEVGAVKTASLENILPVDATDPSVVWSSSKVTALRVNASNGQLEALAAEDEPIAITARSLDGVEKTCSVKVNLKKPTKLEISPSTLTMQPKDVKTLTLTFTPAESVDERVLWESNNEAVATVVDGVITALVPGVAIITAQSQVDPARIAMCAVTVAIPEAPPVNPIALKVNPEAKTLHVNEELVLSCTFVPENATDQSVLWSSSNPDIAEVYGGSVKAKAIGVSEIAVSSVANPEAKAICTITVVPQAPPVVPLTGLSLEPREYSLKVGETLQLSLIFTPNDATNKDIRWSSSEDAVATIEQGVVSAHSTGQAVITATSLADEKLSATCLITVVPNGTRHIEEIFLDLSKVMVQLGDSIQLQVRVIPDDASKAELVWKSDDEGIATVKAGMVKGVKIGETSVTVMSQDGAVKAFCSVIVLDPQINSVECDALANVSVFPNPVAGQLNIHHEGGIEGYELLDVAGKIALRGKALGGNAIALDLRHLPSGIYVLRVQHGEKWRTFRIVR